MRELTRRGEVPYFWFSVGCEAREQILRSAQNDRRDVATVICGGCSVTGTRSTELKIAVCLPAGGGTFEPWNHQERGDGSVLV